MVLVTPVFGVRAPQLLAGRAGRCGPQRWREASGGRGARDYCLRPGEWPEGGGVAGGLLDVGAPPGSPAGVSEARCAGLGVLAGAGPRCPGAAGVASGCFGWLRPAPARRWSRPALLSGSPGPEWTVLWQFTGDATFSLFYLVLDWAACALCFGGWIFLLLSDFVFFFPSANDPIPESCCLSRIRCASLLKDEETV